MIFFFLAEVYADTFVHVSYGIYVMKCMVVAFPIYGMITVLLGSRYDIKKLFRVGRNCFKPAPNVDSAVISLDKHNKYDIKDKDSA